MRYRKISYRFTKVIRGSDPRLLGEPWAELPRVAIARPHWRPPADLYETAYDLTVKIELAGVAEEEIEITLYSDALVVEGNRSCASPDDARYHAAEIRYGPFRLEVALPSRIDRERVSARYELGFLYVTLPKSDGG